MDSNLHITNKDSRLIFTRLRIIKNLIVISCTYVLLYTAYDGLSMLQSTMNGKQGIGSASQAVVYIAFAVSSLLLPKYTIKKLGCKMTMFVSTVLYLPYISANVYSTWFTMMSSAVLLGIGAGTLWASQCTYFNEAAGIYCKLVEDCKQAKKDIATKSGEKKFELFVIQNGINEELPSQPGLKFDGKISSQDTYEMPMKDGLADSGVKIISENNQDYKQNITTSDTQRGKQTELNTQNDKSHNILVSQQTRTISINSLGNKKYINDKEQIANTENVNSESEDRVLKDFLKYTEKENDLTMNTQPLSVQCINKNTSFTNESLNNKIISENPSQFCNLESITARFFGCFGMMYYTAQVWSNLLSYYVLNISSEENATFVSNFSCGAGYCNSEFEMISGGTDEISPSTRYLLVGITVALSVVSSLLVLIFLDPIDSDEEGEVTFSLSHVMATFNHLRKKEQLFIIPLSMFSGLAQGFYTADFTKSYIQCAWSISHIGLVTVFFGLACGISSTISGCSVRFVGRVPVVLLGLALHLGTDVFLLLWNPGAETHFAFYLAAALWGTNVGIFYSQIQSFYGLLFKNDEEAAFATHYFCSAMGWTISFAYSDYLCTSIKIYILMVMSCLGTLGYLAADRSFRRRKFQ